jgi:hypothetical protein
VTISWQQFTGPDGASYRQIVVSKEPDTALFRATAEALESRRSGQWAAKLDDIDQRYRDYESRGAKITLHLEHHLGISVFPTDGADADSSSLDLLEEAYRALSVRDA